VSQKPKDHLDSVKSNALDALRLARGMGKQSVSMRRKLFVYWTAMLLVLFSVLLVALGLTGFFSESQGRLHRALADQHERTATTVENQLSLLTAQGITLSGQVAHILDNLLLTDGIEVLNDDAERLGAAETALYPVLYSALVSSPCNGVFVILDATANTQTENAATSRAGMYLRFANLNAKDAVNQDVVLYRGIARVARDNQHELHNRWRLEFDTSLIAAYSQLVEQAGLKPAQAYLWTERGTLTDTWEQAMWLVVPVCDATGTTLGICGLELSDLFMRLSYPAQHSEFGSLVTVIAPLEDGLLEVSRGLTGEPNGTYLSNTDTFTVVEGDLFNTYAGGSTFLGMHSRVNLNAQGGEELYVATLIPKAYFDAAAGDRRATLVLGALAAFAASLLLLRFLSKRFVQPIVGVLASIKNGTPGEAEQTGISEIDTLVDALDTKAAELKGGILPADVQDLLDDFAQRFSALTPTEQSVVRLYAEGREVNEVAELAFISIHTVRKHNANIYRKLDVGSREELVLYLEIFRRCGRLGDLLGE